MDAALKTADAIIAEMVQRIVDGFQPEKIVLFGSHARGAARDDSDADLLVILRNPGSRRRARLKIRGALHGMGLAKDVFVASPEDVERDRDLAGTLIRPALREGKSLYERPQS